MDVQLLTQYERAVCGWEHGVLDPMDPARVSVPVAQAVAEHAWARLGLDQHKRAPIVRAVGRDQDGYISGAYASMSLDGLHLTLYAPCNTLTILHEIAHASVEDPLDRMELKPLVEKEVHGSIWLGNYLFLLDRLMGPKFNTFYLRGTMPQAVHPERVAFYPIVWGKPQPSL